MALIDFILHIDDHLVTIVNQFGGWSYLILFAIIFIETGLVVFPFLPGDSLIFAASAMAANSRYGLNIWFIYFVVAIAAIVGDTVNYEIGAWSARAGEKHNWFNKLINKNNRLAAEKFFERHGPITIVIGRFIPFIRTFVPFVSGGSKMHYGKFITYNVLGGLLLSLIHICKKPYSLLRFWSSPRLISTGPLHSSQNFHSQPIYLIVFEVSYCSVSYTHL